MELMIEGFGEGGFNTINVYPVKNSKVEIVEKEF
jgi:hypothetical protein